MKKVETANIILPGTSPHSQAIIENGFVFTQGMIYLTKEGHLLEGTIGEKVELILSNLSHLLKEAGSSFNKVVKTTIYVTEMSYYPEVNKAYTKFFSDPYPAREVVCVKELPLGADVEISLIASVN